MKLWDIFTGKEIRTFKGHLLSSQSVKFSPDGKYVLSAGGNFEREDEMEIKDFIIRLWNISSGKEVRQFKGHSGIRL